MKFSQSFFKDIVSTTSKSHNFENFYNNFITTLKGWIIQTGKHADGFGLTCTDFEIHVSGDPSIYIIFFDA